jgi:acyl carrier protein
MSTETKVLVIVQDILKRRSLSTAVTRSDDLRTTGLKSLDMVHLMLAIEDEFDIRIPQAEMIPQNFTSIDTIEALVASLLAQA